MANPHVVTALVEKYRRVSFELKQKKQEVQRLKTELWHLECAIKMIGGGYDLRSARWFLFSATGTSSSLP